MKTKFILALALSVSFASTAMVDVYASQNENITGIQTESKQKNDKREYIFDVIKVDDSKVELMYNGEISEDAIIFEDILGNSNITLEKTLFDKDVKPKDRYIIKSMDRIWAIDTTNINKDDVKLDKRYEKPVNMDIKEVPKDATVKDFIIESINEDPVSPSAVLSEVGNPDSKYSIGLDKLQDENPVEGYMYKIYWDGISLESYPAQFGKIYRVEPVLLSTHENNEDNNSKDLEKREFEVTEVHESGVTLAETGNKDNLYNISFKDLKDDKPTIGDRYIITWSGNSTRSYPAQFIDIKDVDKWVKKDEKTSQLNLSELDKALERAEGILNGTKTYNKETASKFNEAHTYAVELKEKNPSQEEVDKASKDLNDAIDGLSEKDKVLTFTFEITEIVDKGGKNVRLTSVDDKEWNFLYDYDSLNDKDAKVGDRYHIDFDGMEVARNTSKYGDILKIVRVDNQKETSDEDKKPQNDDKKVEAQVKITEDKKEQPKAAGKKDEESKKEDKKTVFGNPKTGVGSVLPVAGILAAASAALFKKKN